MRLFAPTAPGICAGLLVLTVPTTGWAVTDAAPQTIWHTPSTGAFANPERGFYHYTATYFRGTAAGDAPLEESRLRAWRTEENVTLVFRVFYLDGHTTGPLPGGVLDSIRADLATARRAGVKLIVRFAYSEDSDADASRDVVLGHIGQLAPVLNGGADVVAHLQAGFIGRWGEWYYSRHFAQNPQRPWDLSEQNWSDRQAVLDALLAKVSPSIPVQLRYVDTHRRLVGADSAGRVGVHNDCFLASDTDYGTYQNADERAYLQELSSRAPVGGETCTPNGTRSQWPTAQKEMADFHWTYLNADYHRDVLNSWGAQGLAETDRKLGYRLRVVSSTVPRRAAPGGAMDVRLVVANDGYAAPATPRPVYLVFTQGTRRVPVRLPADVRQLKPGVTQEVTFRVAAPTSRGTWTAGVWLPDRAGSLRANPAYSIRVANKGMWDSATGVNTLGARVEVR